MPNVLGSTWNVTEHIESRVGTNRAIASRRGDPWRIGINAVRFPFATIFNVYFSENNASVSLAAGADDQDEVSVQPRHTQLGHTFCDTYVERICPSAAVGPAARRRYCFRSLGVQFVTGKAAPARSACAEYMQRHQACACNAMLARGKDELAVFALAPDLL